jgi:DeoR/GlpR family transcriptional regulator of sugar metabolism
MAFNERQKEIIRLLQSNVSVETNKLSEMFGVSPVTIRRDFDVLEQKGLITTIYGGAIINRTMADQFFTEDIKQKRLDERRQMAKIAAGMIRPGQTVLLDAGSTIKNIAIELLSKTDITVLTNSILVINVLAQTGNDVRVFSLPGQFRKSSMCFFGVTTAKFLDQVHVDYAFIGGNGFSYERGLTTTDLEEAHTKMKMAEIADNTVAFVDHWKIGQNSSFTAVALRDVDTLITGSGGDSEQLSKLAKTDIKIIEIPP